MDYILVAMSDIVDTLADFKKRGLSSPAGIHWERLRKLILQYSQVDDDERLPNPLILGGAIASHTHKHERLAEQLAWAERHGCLNEALSYLKLLPEEHWNRSRGDDWDREPEPW